MEQLAIKSDLAFRAVFGREEIGCKQALAKLLEAILNQEIEEISYANPLNLKAYLDDKQSEMDIEVLTHNGERIDIEIQLRNKLGFKDRIIYYGTKLLQETLNNGEDYTKLKACKVISIMDFTLFTENERFINQFIYMEKRDHFILSGISELIFLEMGKLVDKPVYDMGELEKWLSFLKYAGNASKQELLQQIITESEGVKMAYDMLNRVSANDMLRTQIRMQEKAERDYIADINTAKYNGKLEGKLETAKTLLLMGSDIAFTAKATKLSVTEIEQLAQQLAAQH